VLEPQSLVAYLSMSSCAVVALKANAKTKRRAALWLAIPYHHTWDIVNIAEKAAAACGQHNWLFTSAFRHDPVVMVSWTAGGANLVKVVKALRLKQ